MDPFKLLKEDHDKVKGFFREFEKATPRKQYEIAQTVFEELAVHEEIEEKIFYPAVKEGATKQGQALVLEGYVEHGVMDDLIKDLKKMEEGDELFEPTFRVLTENVEHHIQEEEEQMFPEARKALGEDAGDIGDQMMELKEKLMAKAGAR